MKKHRLLYAAMVIALGLPAGIAAPAPVHGAGLPAGTSTAADNSHATAVYKAALPLLADSAKLPQAIRYLNANMYAVTSYQATLLSLKLENLHTAALPAWESRFAAKAVQRELESVYKAGSSMAELAAGTKNAAVRALLSSAGEHGYKLETAEGTYFPVIDYAAYRKYKAYVMDDIRDYITIMSTESDLPASRDNGLVIAWSEVAARALSSEQFVRSYPKSNRAGAVKALYNAYESNTFYGQNNSPLFHYVNGEMDLEAQKAYSGLLAKNGKENSPFLQKLDGFMKLLKENGYKLDDSIEAYRKEHAPLS
ncbi:hypothetical protein [Paenibacillus tengchongensis]|uniref:hypothetical protein n=1 Tax=Paenibacillus tengchongensis TaxID=2608684 RepID=UPI00124BD896|nr:hypothetical protein [Paenibacillus tengchongensis]